MKIGWIGVGRMGLPMVLRLLHAGYAPMVWNRTFDKAAPLAAQGATVVHRLGDLRGADVVFTMLATGRSVLDVCVGPDGLAGGGAKRTPGIVVDCSTIGMDESRELRSRLAARGVEYLAAPVSGNPRCVVAGKLSSVVSGSAQAMLKVRPLIEAYSGRGMAYVGEGELARVCKIAHNVLLAATITNLFEVILIAQKAGISRHAFLQFINSSVIGSMFTQYKSSALVNLDWTTTFTVGGLLKDIDLGLQSAHALGVSAPITAAVREVFQAHLGVAALRPDAREYLQKDFAAMFETMAAAAGITPVSENLAVPTGLEPPPDERPTNQRAGR